MLRSWNTGEGTTMPFIEQGASGEPMRSLGRVSNMRVDPAMVLQLKAELQPIHDEVEEFLNYEAEGMTVRPLGADPVSRETADAFNENSQNAIDMAWAYRDELKKTLDTLEQAAKDYNLVEDTNEQTFRQDTE
jgi:hypothetical protein